MQAYDIVILGAGPGGYVAALRASQLGLRVALVEDQGLGGVCLNWGCIPTKALLKSAEMVTSAHQMAEFGIKVGPIEIDIQKMVERSRQVVGQLTHGVAHLLKKSKTDVHFGRGSLAGKEKDLWRINIDPKEGGQPKMLLTRNVILATGARPKTFLPENTGVWFARQAMSPEKIPESLFIIGAGAIGIEFASFYNALGTKVWVVEQGTRILPSEDHEISAMAQQIFSQKGIEILVEHVIEKVQPDPKGFHIQIVDKKTHQKKDILAEKVLMAIGVTGNIENIGLDHTCVEVKNGTIVTHGCAQTQEKGIYAIGDVAGAPALAHKASHEAIRCVEFIAGLNPTPLQKERVPGCIYSWPQIASLGFTEDQAQEQGLEFNVGRFSFGANGQALTQGCGQGMIKVLFEKKTGQFLGAHMIGKGVSEMMGPFIAAQGLEGCVEDFEALIFPHPTMSEALHEAVLASQGRALHV